MQMIGTYLASCLIGAAGALPMLRALMGRRRAAQYRAVFEQSPNGLLIAHGESFRIVEANPAMQQSLGYSIRELRKLTLPQLLVDERIDAESLSTRLRQPDPGHSASACPALP